MSSLIRESRRTKRLRKYHKALKFLTEISV